LKKAVNESLRRFAVAGQANPSASFIEAINVCAR
jgi:hypothetical protein